METKLPSNPTYRETARLLTESVEAEETYLYLLECERPNETVQTMIQRAESHSYYNTAPSWMEIALRAHHLVYVGQTENPIGRITTHAQGTDDAALFTRLFPPHAVRQLKRCDSRDDALRREALLRQRLNEAIEKLFAYSDLEGDENWFTTIDDSDTAGVVG
ncbi:GIY-YIG nuclease family protein [Halocatena marina]|uniref:GIY-YIG nuclease family protein n=1 Tax=Halocatena marina TaxID=2934937 RepID=UPI00200C6EFC|nr:GIY-YIG nuclease family protein [Halocatena marina]